MLPVERLVIHALAGALRPRLAIEVGTERGDTARLIARYAQRLICIDIDPAVRRRLADCANIEVVTGDSARELPRLLAELAGAGRGVDFCFVDGDHSYEGVRADLSALLASPAAARTVILVHDSAMAGSRRALRDAVAEARVPIAACDADFSQGVATDIECLSATRAGGLALIVTGADPALARLLRVEPGAVTLPELCERIAPTRAGLLLRGWRQAVPKRLRDRLYRWRRGARR